jgi:hypothetical protein
MSDEKVCPDGLRKIFHGGASKDNLAKARRIAPSYDHGNTWSPNELNVRDEPWIYDNGAYSAWVNDETWDADNWLNVMSRAYEAVADGRMPEPEFIVLPDVVGDAEATYARTERYFDECPNDWGWYFAMQDGMNIERACRFARDLGCGGVFVGGTSEWKQKHAEEIVLQAHLRGMEAHIARPSLPRASEVTQEAKGFRWAERIGADSCDTTTVVINGTWKHLRRLEQQSDLSEVRK